MYPAFRWVKNVELAFSDLLGAVFAGAVCSASDCRSMSLNLSPAHKFRWSWYNFYSHSPPSADSKSAVLQLPSKICAPWFYLTDYIGGLRSRNNLVRLTDRRYMTEILLLWRKTKTSKKINQMTRWYDAFSVVIFCERTAAIKRHFFTFKHHTDVIVSNLFISH